MVQHALLALVLFGAVTLSRCEFSTHATDAPAHPDRVDHAASVGDRAPAFSLVDQSGAHIGLGDFAGKIVVLEWVNPDCPFVERHADARTMSGLAARYAPKGVVWLGINTTKYMTTADNAAWATGRALAYPILDDHDGTVGRLYGARTTPHMFVIDAGGTIAYAGAVDDDAQGTKTERVNYVESALDDLLAGRPIAVPRTKPYGCSVKFAD